MKLKNNVLTDDILIHCLHYLVNGHDVALIIKDSNRIDEILANKLMSIIYKIPGANYSYVDERQGLKSYKISYNFNNGLSFSMLYFVLYNDTRLQLDLTNYSHQDFITPITAKPIFYIFDHHVYHEKHNYNNNVNSQEEYRMLEI